MLSHFHSQSQMGKPIPSLVPFHLLPLCSVLCHCLLQCMYNLYILIHNSKTFVYQNTIFTCSTLFIFLLMTPFCISPSCTFSPLSLIHFIQMFSGTLSSVTSYVSSLDTVPIRYDNLQRDLSQYVHLFCDEFPTTVTQAFDLLQKTSPEVTNRGHLGRG